MTTYSQEDDQDYKSYATLCQIDCCIRWNLTKDRRHLEKLLRKTKNIDYQISAKGKFVSHTNEELIGKTALHLACDIYWHESYIGKCESIQLLLNNNADTTIKDALGLTALLGLVVQCKGDNWTREGSFACGCVNRLLSAQVASNKRENPCNEHGLSHFHVACMANHSAAVEFFLEHGVDVNQIVSIDSPIFSGYSPLHFAVSSCALETVEILLENGADLLLKNADGLTAFHLLLNHGVNLFNTIAIYRESDGPIIKTLLADIDAIQKIMHLLLENFGIHQGSAIDEFGLTVVHLVCTLKNESLIEQLLMNDAVDVDQAIYVNSPICPGFTPLHFAAMFNLDTAITLLKKGADLIVKNSDGRSSLDLCLTKYSKTDVYRLLSVQSAWGDIVMSDGKTKLIDLVQSMQDHTVFESFVKDLQKQIFVPVHAQLWPGYTPLHLAVTFAERVDVELCMRQCSNVRDLQGRIKVDLSIVEKCLQWNPEALIAQDISGSTPLHLAFLAKKLRVAIMLLDNCGQENPANEENLSHLHIACAVGHHAAVESLMTGAYLDARIGSNYVWFKHDWPICSSKLTSFQIKSGFTPLHITLANNEYKIAKILLKGGADINATDDNGMTPIHWLFEQNLHEWSRKETIFLWWHPALKDVIAKDTGLSHLHVAVDLENVKAIERLLKSGADPNAAISNQLADSHRLGWCIGDRPLDLLHISDTRAKITGLLLQYGADVLAATSRNKSSILTNIFNTIECTRVFATYLKENEAEQRRISESTGVTMLHLACYLLDLELVETILRNDKSDINAQVHQDSRFWPGCTPLHTLMLWNEMNWKPDKDDADFLKKFKILCSLLLKNGADVTLWSDKYGTPMHVTILHSYPSSAVSLALAICVNDMLDKYDDFHKNPMNRNGITLFHVACRMNAVRAAKKFLENGVDVNEPIDRFLCCSNISEYSNFTPLHLCLTQQYSLRMVDLLLNHGANVHAESYRGDTPLHRAALCCQRRQKVFERLIAAGANVNAENVYCETPLALALQSGKATAREMKFFCEHGYNRNYFNNVTQLGFMSYVFQRRWDERTMWSLADSLCNAPGFCETDEMGRTALHNIVACVNSTLTRREYVALIEMHIDIGCTVDAQNISGTCPTGQTALHYAAYFLNPHAVSALLLAGADINVVDGNDNTPYSCALNPYTAMCDTNYFCFVNCGSTIEVLANHVQQLQFLNLYVSKRNAKIQEDLIQQGYSDNTCLKDRLKVDLDGELKPYSGCAEELKIIHIGNPSITLADFLTDGGIVFAYPTMSEENREDISKFFKNNRLSRLKETFGKHTKFLNLQYGKALARKTLLDEAKMSFMTLTGFIITEFCAHIIVKFLSNDDLKNVNVSASISL